MLNKSLPKINYIGNKSKISKWIVDSFPNTKGTILDLFAGGCSVAYEAKKRGYQIITNDSLYSSFVISKALIENNNHLLDKSAVFLALEQVLDLERRRQLDWLSERLYFTEEVDELTKLVSYSETLKGYQKYIFQSLIRRAMIRKLPYSRMNIDWNNILKLRDEEYSYKKYGRRRAYHNEPFINHIAKDIESYNNAIFNNGLDHISLQMDAIDALHFLNQKIDIIYLDPPYPGTMNQYDSFYGAFDEIFNCNIKYSDITKGSNFLEFIAQILPLAKKKTKHMIISLNSNSNPGISDILPLLEEHGLIEIKTRKHNYQVSGENNKNNNTELLAILTFY